MGRKKSGGRGKRSTRATGYARPNPPAARRESLPAPTADPLTADPPTADPPTADPAPGPTPTPAPGAAAAAAGGVLPWPQRYEQERARARTAVAPQWDQAHNRPLTLQDTPVSTSVWWRCAAGHRWQEPINQRLSTKPKWKNGDPATCRECVGPLPGDLVEHTYPCGHSARVRRATAQLGRPRCWDCEQPYREAARAERKRTAARESYQRVRRHGRPSDEERTAQRRLVGLLNTTRVLADDHGVAITRDDALAEVLSAIDSTELAELLTLLAVPHTVHHLDAGHDRLGRGRITAEVRIAWADLDALERWAPTTARRVREVRDAHRLDDR